MPASLQCRSCWQAALRRRGRKLRLSTAPAKPRIRVRASKSSLRLAHSVTVSTAEAASERLVLSTGRLYSGCPTHKSSKSSRTVFPEPECLRSTPSIVLRFGQLSRIYEPCKGKIKRRFYPGTQSRARCFSSAKRDARNAIWSRETEASSHRTCRSMLALMARTKSVVPSSILAVPAGKSV